MPTVPIIEEGWDPDELNMLRYNTSAFIAAHPSVIELTPRERVRAGTGLSFVDGEPRPAQVLRVIDQSSSRSASPGLVTGSDGKERQAEHQVLGDWDAEIGLYDWWASAEGFRFEVAELLPYNGYERRALVVRYGQ